MKRPSSDRHVMKQENSDPVLLVEMTENTSLGRIVWSLKAVDDKAAQPERPLVGYRDWGTSVVFLNVIWFKIFKASVSPVFSKNEEPVISRGESLRVLCHILPIAL